MGTDKDIAKAYQALWNNRTLPASTLEEAEKAIDLELLDQRTHPRLRKSPEEKFALAVRLNCRFPARGRLRNMNWLNYIRSVCNFKRRKRGAL